MKSFKQYIKENVYGGLSTIYHRTHSIKTIDAIKDSGFLSGYGAMYGKGIYGTYSLKSQLNDFMKDTYGEYIIKAKVNNNKILFLDMDQAKKVYGKNYTLVDQLKKVSPKIRIDQKIEKISNELLEKPQYTSEHALEVVKIPTIAKSIYGISFTGKQDGTVFLIYNESSVTPMSYNTTSKNSKKLDSREWIDIKNTNLIRKGLDTTLDGFSKNLRNGIKSIEGDLKYLKNYKSWIEEGIFKDAIIEVNSKNLIWKDGRWQNGTWENGIWKNGTFVNGKWNDGIWEDGKWLYATFANGTWKKGIWAEGTWYNGTWEDGVWKRGHWWGGTWKSGTWEMGEWHNGTWENGTWQSGEWENGIWKNGIWENGTWYGGYWYGGTWKSGTWKTGEWRGGKWEGGKIYSTKYKVELSSSVNPKDFYTYEYQLTSSLGELKTKVR